MDNNSDLFDLKREKQELDNFLSTLAEADTLASAQPKVATPAKDLTKPAPEPVRQAPPTLRPLASADRTEEAFLQPPYKEKPVTSPAGETIALKPIPVPETEFKPKITSSFLPDAEEKRKAEVTQKVTMPQDTKLPESPKSTMPYDQSAMDKTTKPELIVPAAERITPEIEKEKKEQQKETPEVTPEVKKAGAGKRIGLLIVLVLILLAGALWMFSTQIVNVIRSLPGAQSVTKMVSSEKEINLVNVRQRLVENKKIGKSVRVIEGLVSNDAPQPVSNIKIVAKLQDAGGSELISMECFAGNILIDEKLETLDANAIKAALLSTKGAQDKIPTKGQIPFMIVFIGEPAGVFKMSVSPTDFKKH